MHSPCEASKAEQKLPETEKLCTKQSMYSYTVEYSMCNNSCWITIKQGRLKTTRKQLILNADLSTSTSRAPCLHTMPRVARSSNTTKYLGRLNSWHSMSQAFFSARHWHGGTLRKRETKLVQALLCCGRDTQYASPALTASLPRQSLWEKKGWNSETHVLVHGFSTFLCVSWRLLSKFIPNPKHSRRLSHRRASQGQWRRVGGPLLRFTIVHLAAAMSKLSPCPCPVLLCPLSCHAETVANEFAPFWSWLHCVVLISYLYLGHLNPRKRKHKNIQKHEAGLQNGNNPCHTPKHWDTSTSLASNWRSSWVRLHSGPIPSRSDLGRGEEEACVDVVLCLLLAKGSFMVMEHPCILDHRIIHALSFQILPHGLWKEL